MSTQHNDDEVNQAEPAIDAAFLSLLQLHRGGQVLTDLSQAMREAIEAAQAQGKPAGITLKMVFKPAANGSNAVVVADKIKTTLPEPKPVTSFFFSDAHGNLHRNDPNQRELALRPISGGKAVDVTTLRQAKAI
jgi:hypothetical protein